MSDMIHKIPLSEFVQNYQSLAVGAGSSGTVWSFTIPHSMVAFITRRASVQFPSSITTLEVDGQRLQSSQLHLGDFNSPYEIDPPMVSRQSIRVIVNNNDGSSHTYAAFIDGYLVMRGELNG